MIPPLIYVSAEACDDPNKPLATQRFQCNQHCEGFTDSMRGDYYYYYYYFHP